MRAADIIRKLGAQPAPETFEARDVGPVILLLGAVAVLLLAAILIPHLTGAL